MRIAEMRHRLVLESPLEVPDGAGGSTESWQIVDQFWGRIRPLSGREGFEADHLSAEIDYEIMIRYRTTVEPEMRLIYDGRHFSIQAVIDPDERKRWLRLLCRESGL